MKRTARVEPGASRLDETLVEYSSGAIRLVGLVPSGVEVVEGAKYDRAVADKSDYDYGARRERGEPPLSHVGRPREILTPSAG
jgi:hypothetical protein